MHISFFFSHHRRRLPRIQIRLCYLTQYMGASLIRNSAPPRPYSRTMPRALWWSRRGAVSYERGTPVNLRFGLALEPLCVGAISYRSAINTRYMQIYIHIYIQINKYTHINVLYIYRYIDVHTCIYVYVYVYIYMYIVYIYIFIHIYTYIYLYIYIYEYIYIICTCAKEVRGPCRTRMAEAKASIGP